MRNQIKLYAFFVLTILINGCTKDKVPEPYSCAPTEIPGEYFPSYLNSYWNYRDNFNQSINFQISNDYRKQKDKCLPVFLNLDVCVKQNSLIYTWYCGLGTECALSSVIYSLNKDEEFICPISFATLKLSNSGQEPSFRRKTTALDTSLMINTTLYQNVIVVNEYDVINPDHEYIDYFSRNVGLIRRDSVSVVDSTQHIPILILDHYSIGN